MRGLKVSPTGLEGRGITNTRHYFCIVVNLHPPLITAVFFIKIKQGGGNMNVILVDARRYEHVLKRKEQDC